MKHSVNNRPRVNALRIIQVVNVRWFNATAWYALELSRLLKESGHSLLVITLENTEAHRQAVAMGFEPVCLPLNALNPIVFFKLIQEIRGIVREYKPHIVNCHRGESFFLWGLLRNFGGYALVRTRGDQRKPKATLCNKFLHRRMTDAVITTNSGMERFFSSVMDVPKERLHMIIGGVNARKFYFSEEGRRKARLQYGFEADHCVIGLLGRFDTVKGQKELIYSIASLIQEGLTNIRLLLIGFPTDVTQEEVEFWARDAGIKEHVFITGEVEDVSAHISALDIGVVSSLWSETVARAALEIMACKRPLVSTNVGVMPDLLPQEALVDPLDRRGFIRLLKKAVVDLDWRTRLMEICYRRSQELTSEAFLATTLEAYEKALYLRS